MKIKKNIFKKIFLILTSFFIILVCYYYYQFYYLKNFRVLIPDLIYRSGQPSVDSIKFWQNKYGIKSLINLRGHDYTGEMKEVFHYSDKYNISHRSVRISSRRLPSEQNLNLIVDYILNLPKPLLIHCMRGVDRTGLFSIVALLLNNSSIDEAMEQVSWDKGFFPYREQDILLVLIKDYESWLKDKNIETNRDNFIYWAQNIYKPLYYSTNILISRYNQKYNNIDTIKIKKNTETKFNINIKNTSNYILPFNLVTNKKGISMRGCVKKHLDKYSDRSCIYLYRYKRKPKGFNKKDVFVFDGEQLQYNLRPHKSIELDLVMPKIETAGLYQLEVDLYDSDKSWFSEYAYSNSAKLNVEVS